jgi:hypothetical protein
MNASRENIYAYYLGVDDGAPIPLAVTVDGRKVLVKFYDEKEDFIRRSRRFSEREKEQYLRNCQQARTHALAQFDARENFEVFPSIAAFVERIDAISNRVHSALDWAEIERRMGLSSEELELVRNLSGKVDGKMLLAYALTELFPAQTGLSIKIFEQYIKNGGVHILELIPAIYDRYISHGLAQFTSFALKDTGTEIVGASVINRALPEAEQIPRSVLYTDTYQEQFKGMHLFGVYNMARLVKRLNRNERALLRNNLEAPVLGIALTQFLASAHHAPAHGYTAMQRFIRAGMRGSHKEHARERVQPYIQEAHDYYRELEDILARRG